MINLKTCVTKFNCNNLNSANDTEKARFSVNTITPKGNITSNTITLKILHWHLHPGLLRKLSSQQFRHVRVLRHSSSVLSLLEVRSIVIQISHSDLNLCFSYNQHSSVTTERKSAGIKIDTIKAQCQEKRTHHPPLHFIVHLGSNFKKCHCN